MGKEIKTFKEELSLAYIENPCDVQATALWKTLRILNDFKTDFEVKDSRVERLKIWNEDSIFLHWNRNSNEINIQKERLETLKFMLIHNRYLENIPKDIFTKRTSYFRLIHNGEVQEKETTNNFIITEVNIQTELEKVSKFICDCYENIKPNVDEVKKWTKHSVFDNNLWIWIIDKKNNKPAGLGIAEIDKNVSEGSLEWIQALPEYRGKGLGEIIVKELLNRLRDKVNFITVSGEIDNNSNPEKLYRKCGFIGNDIWWVLRK